MRLSQRQTSVRRWRLYWYGLVFALLFSMAIAACSAPETEPEPADNQEQVSEDEPEATTADEEQVGDETSEESQAEELQTVRVGMSAFQDVNSLHVGIEQGFFAEEGIEFDIQNTDWSGAQELLVGGHVDIATASDADVIIQNAQGQDTTLAFPLYYFAGGGLMYDPERFDWKTFDEFMEETDGDLEASMRQTLEQLVGKRVGVSATAGEYATFVGMVNFAGLKADDFQIVDLAQEELPPALLSDSIDVMIAGIPQRLAVLDEGYATLVDQTALPSTVVHAGFSAHRSWVDENPELAAKIQKGIFRTLDYIEKNPDEAFPIIADHLREMGTNVDPADLQGVWNEMEFFPPSIEAFEEQVVSPDGRFYWRDRWQSVAEDLQEEGKIEELNVPLEDLFYGLKVVEWAKELE